MQSVNHKTVVLHLFIQTKKDIKQHETVVKIH